MSSNHSEKIYITPLKRCGNNDTHIYQLSDNSFSIITKLDKNNEIIEYVGFDSAEHAQSYYDETREHLTQLNKDIFEGMFDDFKGF